MPPLCSGAMATALLWRNRATNGSVRIQFPHLHIGALLLHRQSEGTAAKKKKTLFRGVNVKHALFAVNGRIYEKEGVRVKHIPSASRIILFYEST